MKKSVLKKIKMRGNKVFRWPMGKGHNRTRKSSNLLRHKRKQMSLTGVNVKLLKNYLRAK